MNFRENSNKLINLFNFFVLILIILLSISFIIKIFILDNVNPELVEYNQTSTKIIQAEIKNGSGEDGIAKKTKIFLRNRGFDVVEIGNYDSIINNSFIIDRKGNFESSLMLAKSIGISDSLIISIIDSSLSLNSTIILGKDYKNLKPFKTGE